VVSAPACPKCGALIFYPSPWNGITPPPAQYTCDCKRDRQETITTTSTDLGLRLRVESRHRHCDSCRCQEIASEREARSGKALEYTYTRDPSKPLPVVLL
jgi:hypothetical protein